MRRLFWAMTVLGWVVVANATSLAAEWGNLSGRFLFDGIPPIPEKLKITSDQPTCGPHDLQNEALLVNPLNKGVQNIIVYLFQNKSGARLTPYDSKVVPIHEDYLAREKEVVKLDNQGCRFDPHVALIWNRQKVLLGNSDPVGHNVKIDCRDNPQSNDTIPAGGQIEKKFEKAERFPAPVSCSIHPWMKGWLVIRDTPYMAVSDADGKFEIKNLPAGEWQFMFWQEQAGYVSNVKIGGKAEEWKRGLKLLTIKPGQQDLGDIVLAPALFKN